MRGDKVKVGDIVTFRGKPAKVIEVWKRQADAPKGFISPVGCMIEYRDGENTYSCRMQWPDLTDAEWRAIKYENVQGGLRKRAQADRDALILRVLEDSLESRQIEVM